MGCYSKGGIRRGRRRGVRDAPTHSITLPHLVCVTRRRMCCCRVAVRPAVKRTCVRGSASSPAGGGVLSLTRVAIHAASPEGAGFPTRRCELTTHFLSALSKILDLFLFIKTIFFYKLIHSCFFKGEFLFEELKIRRVRSKRSPLRNI